MLPAAHPPPATMAPMNRFLAVACVLLAVSGAVAQEKSKTFTIKLVATAGQDNVAKLGDTAVLV